MPIPNGDAIVWLAALVREATLFAAFGLLVCGVDDLLVDGVFFVRWLRGRPAKRTLADLPAACDLRLAIFVPAWDESAVIGAMLRATLARFDWPDYRVYVGCYPNDPATIAAVAGVARCDSRVRLVIGPRDGPTTKADCLNVLWRALLAGETQSAPTRAVVLHDAEDVVHPAEARVFAALLADHAIVQIPVLPLIDRGSRLVSGHYADEFADAHWRVMTVRAALGAGLPLAGVGCAITVEALTAVAAIHGTPFDPGSLTEDYELGLRVAATGRRTCFVRVREGSGGALIAVREYFPRTLDAAVRQKSRWMTGIALAGWDRIGWGRALHLAEHWMRMRDRRAPLAVLATATAWLGLFGWMGLLGVEALGGRARTPPAPMLMALLSINAVLLGWRVVWRIVATTRHYGWREGVWSVPRMLVGNLIALFALYRAIGCYAAILAGAAPVWDKTAHVFPADAGDQP